MQKCNFSRCQRFLIAVKSRCQWNLTLHAIFAIPAPNLSFVVWYVLDYVLAQSIIVPGAKVQVCRSWRWDMLTSTRLAAALSEKLVKTSVQSTYLIYADPHKVISAWFEAFWHLCQICICICLDMVWQWYDMVTCNSMSHHHTFIEMGWDRDKCRRRSCNHCCQLLGCSSTNTMPWSKRWEPPDTKML